MRSGRISAVQKYKKISTLPYIFVGKLVFNLKSSNISYEMSRVNRQFDTVEGGMPVNRWMMATGSISPRKRAVRK
jgi:hypothetical protein